jgi:prepilin-type N-terminal cleavage/methylation domain-containing protein
MFKTFISALFKNPPRHFLGKEFNQIKTTKNGAGFIQHHFSGEKFNRVKTVKSGAGFTLIELMVVMVIITIITTIVLMNYRGGDQQLALNRAANKLAQDIRRAQEMAISSREDDPCDPAAAGYDFQGSYGIQLKGGWPSRYLLLADCNNDKNLDSGDDEVIEEIDLEPGVEIIALASNNLRIVFSPPDPITYFKPDTVTDAWIELGINGYSKIIHVNQVGLIYVE